MGDIATTFIQNPMGTKALRNSPEKKKASSPFWPNSKIYHLNSKVQYFSAIKQNEQERQRKTQDALYPKI